MALVCLSTPRPENHTARRVYEVQTKTGTNTVRNSVFLPSHAGPVARLKPLTRNTRNLGQVQTEARFKLCPAFIRQRSSAAKIANPP